MSAIVATRKPKGSPRRKQQIETAPPPSPPRNYWSLPLFEWTDDELFRALEVISGTLSMADDNLCKELREARFRGLKFNSAWIAETTKRCTRILEALHLVQHPVTSGQTH